MKMVIWDHNLLTPGPRSGNPGLQSGNPGLQSGNPGPGPGA